MKGLAKLLRSRDGALTRELARVDGGFGLGQVPARLVPTATTTAVCGYCSTGCGLDVHLKDGVAVNVSAAADYPVNRGMACPKGWEALAPLTTSRRATRCLLRRSDGRLAPVGWREALDAFVTRFKDIQAAHGPASVAFLGTGQIVTEELALLGVLAKLGMGLKHGDGNTRQCMATAVAAYKECFGFDAPPYTYEDLEESDVLVFWGANPCIAHPILWSRVAASKRQREVVAIDPRRTQTAMAADQHLPIRPKHDLDLAYGLARELAARGAVDERFVAEHTSGFEAFVQHVQPYTLERVSRETGLPEASIRRLADSIEAGKRVSFWWTMGVNQSHQGTRTAQAIIALALMTGQIGRPLCSAPCSSTPTMSWSAVASICLRDCLLRPIAPASTFRLSTTRAPSTSTSCGRLWGMSSSSTSWGRTIADTSTGSPRPPRSSPSWRASQATSSWASMRIGSPRQKDESSLDVSRSRPRALV